MVWPVGHGIVCGMAWRDMPWYEERHSIAYFKARGVADVSWRSCSHLPDPFTSRGPFTWRHHIVYGMAWWTSHGKWYGLARYVMVCGKA